MNTHNLPIQPTPFIGRTDELAEIARLLADPACRLLTLVGAGGIGKTRLAIEAAAACDAYPNGVHFVPLQPLPSSDFIVATIANTLGFHFYSDSTPKEQLLDYLREKALLLVLDNFEHLLNGVHLLSDILDAVPGVKLFVTSRERLNLREEWVLDVIGLNYPSGEADAPIADYSAVQLFVQRAQQTQASFSLAENAEAVKRICQQVEGMPLGLELATSWLRAMSAKQIAAHMTGNLDFLTTPLRNVPERHRSIRSVFEQSWKLLSPAEQNVLMRLSVFRGGFDREAAEQVAGASLHLLAGLADKSLIRLNAAGRYDLHELLRQYAADKLLDAGGLDTTAQRHLDYFLKLAEQVDAHNFGREQIIWYNRVETELDNIRAALARSVESETGLRVAGALGWFFSERTYWIEGLDWLKRMLAAKPDAPPLLRAKALHSAGALAGHLDDHQRASALCQEALALARAASDHWNIAWSLSQLGIHGEQNPEQTELLLEESLTMFRKMDDPMGLCHALIRRALSTNGQQNHIYTRTLLEEASIIAEEADDRISRGWIALLWGEIFWLQDHDLRQAKAYFETSLALFREARFTWAVVNLLSKLAQIEEIMEHDAHAKILYEQALLLQQQWALNNSSVEVMFVGIAGIVRARGELQRAAILLGAAENLVVGYHTAGFPVSDNFRRNMAEILAELGDPAFSEALAVGRAMTREQAIAYALEGRTTLTERQDDSEAAQSPQPASQPLAHPLTEREIEILSLMTEGLSNRDIAERLFLTSGTVKWYLSQIYSKLGVNGRVQAIARARELALLA